ncbi:hypothetical protein [Chamaesiphon sp. VAR_48_metabat_135_sub]|uniref:hypothetical protein n=1 Tax=Chamaesiphon sp. VAR_48_metabat_135_sub TaxID=2964699 RepID=UPI00286A90AE|nr:hypothetical protein [Chamaesiphon sp. VAR_48_metabat_135_sub]
MALSYNHIFALVSMIDDCTILAEEGSCQVEIVSGSGHPLCFSRRLHCRELKIPVDDGCMGTCEYIAYRKNSSSSTMAPNSATATTQFKTDSEKIDSSDGRLRSTIREIIKSDVASARKLAVVNN